MNEPRLRYSDDDLQEFKVLIDKKLIQAQEEMQTTQQQIADLNENGFNQQGGDWYDDSTTHSDLEMLQRMLMRQQRYVQDLKNALLRIENKTYGICSVTGVLIDKSRLRLVPHATKSLDAKGIHILDDTSKDATLPIEGSSNSMTIIDLNFADESEDPALSVEIPSDNTTISNIYSNIYIGLLSENPMLSVEISPGSAPPEEISELLADISILYRKMGGSGIDFTAHGITIKETAHDGM